MKWSPKAEKEKTWEAHTFLSLYEGAGMGCDFTSEADSRESCRTTARFRTGTSDSQWGSRDSGSGKREDPFLFIFRNHTVQEWGWGEHMS